jgi:hypothetical protein
MMNDERTAPFFVGFSDEGRAKKVGSSLSPHPNPLSKGEGASWIV